MNLNYKASGHQIFPSMYREGELNRKEHYWEQINFSVPEDEHRVNTSDELIHSNGHYQRRMTSNSFSRQDKLKLNHERSLLATKYR